MDVTDKRMEPNQERGPGNPDEARILAVDLGSRRIGLALSDPLGLTAQGLETMERRNKRQNMNYLKSLARRHGVKLILIGDPMNMDGSRGPAAEAAEAFAASLRNHVEAEVRLWDERLTTVEADRVLREAGVRREERAKRVDQVAAVVLLESFLQTQRTASHAAGHVSEGAADQAAGSVAEHVSNEAINEATDEAANEAINDPSEGSRA